MDYEKAWSDLIRWLTRQVLDDTINGIVFLEVMDKMDAIWMDAHEEAKDGV